MKVPFCAVAPSHIHEDEFFDLLIQDARLVVLHKWDLQALGIDVGRDPIEHPPNILPVRHASAKGHNLSFMEDGNGEGQVVQMRARGVGVVGEQDVTGLNALCPPKRKLCFDHIAHAANEHR